MKVKLTTTKKVIFFGILFLLAFGFNTNAQKVEKLILYENFGGPDAGTSEDGIQPEKWPSVIADSGEYAGWYATDQKLDGKNEVTSVPQFYGNKTFHIDSVLKYRDGGLPAGINVSPTKRWYKGVPFLNGYTTAAENNTQLEFKFWDATVMAEFSSWISYADHTPDYLKNQTDELGYIYFAKDIAVGDKAILTLPNGDFDYLKDISKLELLISGSRLSKLNLLEVRIEEVDASGTTLGTTKYTYSASVEPRFVTVPVNKDFCRIYFQTWGDQKNGNITDLVLSNGNTNADTTYPFQYNGIAGTTPYGEESSGYTSNPGMQLHMIKMYAMMDGSGYSIITDESLVTGKLTGIAYGETTTLTAAADNGGNNFVGWNIEGQDDLSEIANPLTLTITEDLTITPVYVGDEIEVPVVNETFTNWKQRGNTLPDKNNMLDFNQGDPYSINTVFSGVVKVPLQYGFTSGDKDSVEISLKACNVIPQYGLRVHNAPGWKEALGYVAFMGPNTDKGYVTVESITGISKAVITVSSYDITFPNRACAIAVNDEIKRNKLLNTIYTEDITIENDPANAFQLQVGPGNQAMSEYLVAPAENVDIYTGNSAAAVAMHNLKLYTKMTAPDKSYYQLTLIEGEDGIITGATPEAGNSTNHYIDGSKISVSARADEGLGFYGWYDASDNLVSKSNPFNLTITSDTTLKAKFLATPAYIQIEDNNLGTVTSNIEPLSVSGDTWEFVAGNEVILTAEPIFGYEFVKFIKNGVDVIENPMTVSNTELESGATVAVSVVYQKITSSNTLAVWNNTDFGEITFSPDDSIPTYVDDTVFVNLPIGAEISVKATPNYGYKFTQWQPDMDVPAENLGDNPVDITMDKNIHMAPVWDVLPRKLLIVNQGANGEIWISDEHKNGEQEQQGLWPEDYQVRITAIGSDGFALASLGANVPYFHQNDSVVFVSMIYDTITLNPEFVERLEGVTVVLNENFQDETKWVQNEATVSNVPGAIEFLDLDENWDPTQYNNSLEELLEIMAPYRVWGSESNENSEGPNGRKDPYTTLSLEYETTPKTLTIPIESSQDNVKVTVANYAPCNDCLIGKAVKGDAINNRYLGHVTPGMVALRDPAVEDRDSELNPAFMAGDTVGLMLVEGLVYVEKLEIGYVSNTSQHCPGVFYSLDENLQVIDDAGLFNDVYGELWSIGQVSRPDYRPYDNKYGWGSSQEGMIMDQNMYIAEEDAPETKVIITSGYRDLGETYQYTDIYIHDLKIWGSPKESNSIKDVIANNGVNNNKFYMLGNTNMLQVDIPETVKALVIYNINGQAVKVLRNLNTNEIDLGDLQPGIYGAHAYGVSGKQYQGSFGKVNY